VLPRLRRKTIRPVDGHFSPFWLLGDTDDHGKRQAVYDFLVTWFSGHWGRYFFGLKNVSATSGGYKTTLLGGFDY